MQNKKVVILSIVILISIFFIGGYFYKKNISESVKSVSNKDAKFLQRDYSVVIGPKDAKVTLVEFFDPACGTCAQFHFYVKDILNKYKENIKLVLRYAPFHPNSNYAVKMLEAAKEQNLFMPTLEFMLNTQNQWVDGHTVNPRKLWTLLPNVPGLDMTLMAKAMEKAEFDKIVEQDLSDARALNVRKTPSYFVNGIPLKVFGLDNLIKLIESEL